MKNANVLLSSLIFLFVNTLPMQKKSFQQLKESLESGNVTTFLSTLDANRKNPIPFRIIYNIIATEAYNTTAHQGILELFLSRFSSKIRKKIINSRASIEYYTPHLTIKTTPLLFALDRRLYNIAKILINHGAKITDFDSTNQDIFHKLANLDPLEEKKAELLDSIKRTFFKFEQNQQENFLEEHSCAKYLLCPYLTGIKRERYFFAFLPKNQAFLDEPPKKRRRRMQ